VVGFTTMEHTVQRFECVRASVATSAPIWCAASLAALHESLVEGSQISFLRRCSEVLLPIFWWPVAVRINAMYWFGVASLIFVVPKSWSFTGL
jgi:hypothetical protein